MTNSYESTLHKLSQRVVGIVVAVLGLPALIIGGLLALPALAIAGAWMVAECWFFYGGDYDRQREAATAHADASGLRVWTDA